MTKPLPTIHIVRGGEFTENGRRHLRIHAARDEAERRGVAKFESAHPPTREAQIMRNLHPAGAALLITPAPVIVGPLFKREIHIGKASIIADPKRSGYGSSLLTHAERIFTVLASAKGMPVVHHAETGSPEARRFYRQHGYQDIDAGTSVRVYTKGKVKLSADEKKILDWLVKHARRG